MPEVRTELDRYGLTELIGPANLYPSLAAVERAFRERSSA